MGTQLCALNVPLVALVRLNGIYNGLGGGWSSAFPFGSYGVPLKVHV